MKLSDLIILFCLFCTGCLGASSSDQVQESQPQIVVITATPPKNNQETQQPIKAFELIDFEEVMFVKSDTQESIRCLELITERFSGNTFENGNTLFLELLGTNGQSQHICLGRVDVAAEGEIWDSIFAVEMASEAVKQLDVSRGSKVFRIRLEGQDGKSKGIQIDLNSLDHFPDFQLYDRAKIEQHIGGLEYFKSSIIKVERIDNETTRTIGRTIAYQEAVDVFFDYVNPRVIQDTEDNQTSQEGTDLTAESTALKQEVLNFITHVNTYKYIERGETNHWQDLPDVPERSESFDYWVTEEEELVAWAVGAEKDHPAWHWDKNYSMWVKAGREGFDQEKFLENLGEPQQYTIQAGKDLVPGMNRDGLRDTGYFSIYGLVASYPYPFTWTSEEDFDYTLWLVDLAFPKKGLGSRSWFTIPFIVWIDYDGTDPRVVNFFAYSISELRTVKLNLNGWDFDVRICTFHPSPDEDRQIDHIDEKAYIKARNKALSPFNPGQGIFIPHLSIPGTQKLEDLSEKYIEDEERPGSNPFSKFTFLFQAMVEDWNMLTPGCFEDPTEMFAVLEHAQCEYKEGGFNYGGVLGGSVQLFNIDW